jgi:hypothetical protein
MPYFYLTTALSFGGATLLSAMSSKNRSEDQVGDTTYQPLYAKLAAIDTEAAPEKRAELLNKMANYAALQPDMKDGDITSKEIVEEVQKRVAVMEKNPFLPKGTGHGAAVRGQQQEPIIDRVPA